MIVQRVVARAWVGVVLLGGLVALTGEGSECIDLFSGKHRVCGMSVRVVAGP